MYKNKNKTLEKLNLFRYYAICIRKIYFNIVTVLLLMYKQYFNNI